MSEGSKLFNYSDVFFSYFLNNDMKCAKAMEEHSLGYILSGELMVEQNGEQIPIRAGECVFLRRDYRVKATKQAVGDEQYSSIFLKFKRSLLREYYRKMGGKNIPAEARQGDMGIVKLPKHPAIAGLFHSMIPYFDTNYVPSKELIRLKIEEGIDALLNIDTRFYACLFDFTDPWKVDLVQFLGENYMLDLSIEDFAHYTGRSLSTFKRDFRKISKLPPQKWLMQKRLEAAHIKLREEGRKATEVYPEVGFKNLSHFSTAYKKRYGVSPRNMASG